MVNFDSIIEWVLRQEDSTLCGEVLNLNDGQGRTRWGIAEHAQSRLPVDFYTKSTAESLEDAKIIYRVEYWEEIWGDQINSDELAATLMNFAVNDGVYRAVRMLQECLNVFPDGTMGPLTISHCNGYDSTLLSAAFRAAQADWYRTVVENQPTDERFLKGWLARAARIYPNLD